MFLEIDSLSKHYGALTALDAVSLTVAEGEFVCFLGPSGCGKTTLLRCIAGLELQDGGSLRQRGQDMSDQPPSARDFGIVFQSYALFPNLTVGKNIGYGLNGKRWSRAARTDRINEMLALVGLQGQQDKFPGTSHRRRCISLRRSHTPRRHCRRNRSAMLPTPLRLHLAHERCAPERSAKPTACTASS